MAPGGWAAALLFRAAEGCLAEVAALRPPARRVASARMMDVGRDARAGVDSDVAAALGFNSLTRVRPRVERQ